jgi:hypothetical protein
MLPVATLKYVNLILNYLEIVGKKYSKEMCRYKCAGIIVSKTLKPYLPLKR